MAHWVRRGCARRPARRCGGHTSAEGPKAAGGRAGRAADLSKRPDPWRRRRSRNCLSGRCRHGPLVHTPRRPRHGRRLLGPTKSRRAGESGCKGSRGHRLQLNVAWRHGLQLIAARGHWLQVLLPSAALGRPARISAAPSLLLCFVLCLLLPLVPGHPNGDGRGPLQSTKRG